LAKTLSGTPTEVNYPIMPVSVKTPSYPITFVLPPSSSEPLKWQIEADENGIKALHYDNDGELNGYILTRDKTADKKQLNPQIKPKYHS
jgi:rubredoxin-NAD+ reductase